MAYNPPMVRLPLILLIAIFTLNSCGQKSTIKTNVNAERLAERYGDGKYIIRSVTFPLDNSALAFNTPIPALGPIAGGILKLIGDIFVSNTKVGSLQYSYTYPLPEIPTEYVKSVRLKRFFFYLKPKKNRKWYDDWISRYILGQGNSTFDFLEKFAVRLSTDQIQDPKNYVPSLQEEFDDKDELKSIKEAFKYNRAPVTYNEESENIILLKYHDKKKAIDTNSKVYGKIHYLETTKSALEVKKFFLNLPIFKDQYKRILLLENSLLIELINDPFANEIFKDIMARYAEKIDKELGVNFIDTCTDRSCLEIKIPDVNLIPLALKGNAVKIDGYVEAGKVPESFKLKGFVEFEVKLDSPI